MPRLLQTQRRPRGPRLVLWHPGQADFKAQPACDVVFHVVVQAGLNPTKEGHAFIPGTVRRPAGILLPRWDGPLDAALDVTVTPPLQDASWGSYHPRICPYPGLQKEGEGRM